MNWEECGERGERGRKEGGRREGSQEASTSRMPIVSLGMRSHLLPPALKERTWVWVGFQTAAQPVPPFLSTGQLAAFVQPTSFSCKCNLCPFYWTWCLGLRNLRWSQCWHSLTGLYLNSDVRCEVRTSQWSLQDLYLRMTTWNRRLAIINKRRYTVFSTLRR